jgi:hypothetical protein
MQNKNCLKIETEWKLNEYNNLKLEFTKNMKLGENVYAPTATD